MRFLKAVTFLITSAIAILITTFYSCKTNESKPPQGEVKFSVNRVNFMSPPDTAIITIKDANGVVVYDQKTFKITQAGNEYVSGPVVLNAGNYSLTAFRIVDKNGIEIATAPMDSLYEAHLADDAIPIAFSVTGKNVTTVAPKTVVTQQHSARFAKGLAAWYPFNGNANDESGRERHGVVSSALLTSDKDGLINRAYHFDGDGYIQIAAEDLMLEEFTYSLWANPTSLPPAGTTSSIFSIGDRVTTHQQTLSFANQYASASFTGLFAGGWNRTPKGLVVANVGTNTLPPANQWFHLVWVRTRQSTALYLNNKLIGTVPNNNHPPYYGKSTVANIGMRCNFTQGFVGKIDNVRIYNRALAPGEIEALYNE